MGGIVYRYPNGRITSNAPNVIKTAEALKSHPNYRNLQPFEGESLVAFALRCSAELVSPPMIDGEDAEIECVDLAKAIITLEREICNKWEKFNDTGYA